MSGEHQLISVDADLNEDKDYVWYFEKTDELVVSKANGYIFKDQRGMFMSVYLYNGELQSPHLRLSYVGDFE